MFSHFFFSFLFCCVCYGSWEGYWFSMLILCLPALLNMFMRQEFYSEALRSFYTESNKDTWIYFFPYFYLHVLMPYLRHFALFWTWMERVDIILLEMLWAVLHLSWYWLSACAVVPLFCWAMSLDFLDSQDFHYERILDLFIKVLFFDGGLYWICRFLYVA